MTHTAAMLETAPSASRYDLAALSRCIESCLDSAQACTACADACLAEKTVGELTRCIGLNLMCADVCAATAFSLSRQATSDDAAVRALVDACVQPCASCAAECEQHADMHAHCRVCAEACRACEQASRELLASE
jgi:hypothetical protein